MNVLLTGNSLVSMGELFSEQLFCRVLLDFDLLFVVLSVVGCNPAS